MGRRAGFQIAAEAVFDIGNHVLSGALRSKAGDYAEVPLLLARHGVIAPELETRLRGLAGFRNLLVHDYARVDLDRMKELLETRLDDFERFAGSVEAWLAAQSA